MGPVGRLPLHWVPELSLRIRQEGRSVGVMQRGLGGGRSPRGLAGHWLWPPEWSFLFLISVYLPIEGAYGTFQRAAPARPPCRPGTSTGV